MRPGPRCPLGPEVTAAAAAACVYRSVLLDGSSSCIMYALYGTTFSPETRAVVSNANAIALCMFRLPSSVRSSFCFYYYL